MVGIYPNGTDLLIGHLDPRGLNLISGIFSIDLAANSGFDATDATGANGQPDGIPDSIHVFYSGNVVSVSYDPNDLDGELEVVLADLSASPRYLPHGKVLEISFPANVSQQPMKLGDQPAPSFGTATGQSVSATLSTLFSDGFESGNLLGWTVTVP